MALFGSSRFLILLGLWVFSADSAWAAKRNFSVELQSWTRQCQVVSAEKALNCEIPQAFLPVQNLSFEVDLAEQIMETRLTKEAFGVDSLKGELRFFSTYPDPNTGLPPYIQIQIEVIAPARALCLQSVRLRDPFMASPLACTNFDSATGRQFGINLKIVEE